MKVKAKLKGDVVKVKVLAEHIMQVLKRLKRKKLSLILLKVLSQKLMVK